MPPPRNILKAMSKFFFKGIFGCWNVIGRFSRTPIFPFLVGDDFENWIIPVFVVDEIVSYKNETKKRLKLVKNKIKKR